MIVSITFKHWFELFWDPQYVDSPQGCWAVCWNWWSSAGYLTPVGRGCESCYTVRRFDGVFFFLLRSGSEFIELFCTVCCSHWRADTCSLCVRVLERKPEGSSCAISDAHWQDIWFKESWSRAQAERKWKMAKKKNPFDEIWMIFSSESSFHRFLEKWHPTSQLCAKVCRFHYLDFSLWFLTLTHQGLSRKSLSGNQTWWSGDQCKAFAPKLHKNATLN